MKFSAKISSAYRRPVLEAATLSAVLLVVSAMVLDMGETIYASIPGIVAFWVIAIVIVLRRPAAPTRADIYMLRFGQIILWIVMQLLTRWIWNVTGNSF